MKLRKLLKSKGKNPLLQHDLVILIPWSGVWMGLKYVWRLASVGLLNHLYMELVNRYEILERCVNRYK